MGIIPDPALAPQTEADHVETDLRGAPPSARENSTEKEKVTRTCRTKFESWVSQSIKK